MQLPKLDTIIIAVFFVCIGLWMLSKCGNRRSDYLQRSTRVDDEQDERPVRRDTPPHPPTATPVPTTTTPVSTAPVPTTVPPVTATPIKQQAAANPGSTPTPQQSQPASPAPQSQPAAANTAPKQTMLYVTIDQLKMRKEPGLKGKSIGQLDLYSQVYFTGERTDWKQEISLGKEKVTDCWVKIKTKEGKIGWVFGAGVNYYKEKRKGVIE